MKGSKFKIITCGLTLLASTAALAGTTYAWFTDIAANTGNVINIGNLGVDLLSYQNGAYVSADESSDSGLTKNVYLFSADKVWAPGDFEVAYLGVQNTGDVDLQYLLDINLHDENNIASNFEGGLVLDYQLDSAGNTKFDDWSSFETQSSDSNLYWNTLNQPSYNYGGSGVVLKAGETAYFALGLHMKGSSTVSSGSFSVDVRVRAKQNSDSAQFPQPIEGVKGDGTESSPYQLTSSEDITKLMETPYVSAYAKLENEITYEEPLENPEVDTGLMSVNEGQTLTLDLNGHDITGSLATNGNNYARAHIILNEGTLNITDSGDGENALIIDTNKTANACTRAIKNAAGATLNIDGATIISTNAVGLLNLGTCNISNSTIKSLNETTGGGGWSNSTAAIENRESGKLTIESSNVSSITRAAIFCDCGSEGYVKIYSGEFYGNSNYGAIDGGSDDYVDLYGGTFNSDVSNMCDINYYFVENNEDSTYEVVARHKAVERIVETEDELISALNSATDIDPLRVVIKEGSNVTLDQTIKIPDGTSLEVDGTLTLEDNAYISNLNNFFFKDINNIKGVPSLDNTNTCSVSDAMDFQWLNFIADESTPITVNITNDIVFPEGADFLPINIFTGTINGNNHTISGINVSSVSSDLGVFQYISSGSTIKDLTFDDLYVKSNTSTAGGLVGVIVDREAEEGPTDSVFQNITMKGTMEISGGSYGVSPFVGAIGVSNNQSIQFIDCTSEMTLNVNNSYNVGTIYGTSESAKAQIGVYNCTNNGTINAYGSVGIVNGWGSLQSGSNLTIIGFHNNGVVYANGKVVTSYLGAASSGKTYDATYADGTKYKAVKNPDGTWTHEELALSTTEGE